MADPSAMLGRVPGGNCYNDRMSVISRIMWTAEDAGLSQAELIDAARRAIGPWAMEVEGGDLPHAGSETFERRGSNPGLRTVSVFEVVEPCGLRVDVEDDDGRGAVWGVQIRIAFSEGRVSAWVDNTLESEAVAAPVSVGRPRVVDELLSVGTKQRLGASAILNEPQDIPVAAAGILAELLTNPERGLPVVAVTCPRAGFDDRGRSRATNLAKRLTGLATVVTLDPDAQDAVKDALPDRLGVWGGAVRVYAPGSLASPAAHRVYTNDLLVQRGVDPVVNWVTTLSSRRRPELCLREVDQAARSSEHGVTPAEIEELRLERDIAQEELENEILERAEVEAELTKALLLVRRLRQLGFESGRSGELDEAERSAADQADALMTVSEAVARARRDLSDYLVLPEGADRDLDRIDAAPNALAWGNTAWRGLNALHDYALDVANGAFAGGFWSWCAREGAWPATHKKLAMSESETVENNAKMRSKRLFKVDRDVAAGGELYMGAHLKISEGGGNLAPRVYFHDDTAGKTKRVHVGFVGPHYLVPNTKS